jgi:hypothetical protein
VVIQIRPQSAQHKTDIDIDTSDYVMIKLLFRLGHHKLVPLRKLSEQDPQYKPLKLNLTFRLQHVFPEQPENYRRRILLAATGLAPQILTETLYALAVASRPAFVPHEVHLITTEEGAEYARHTLLDTGMGQFGTLLRDYSLTGQCRLEADCIHGGCKNFCVNGHRAGNCRIARSDDDRNETRHT